MRSVTQAYKDAFLADTPDVKREVSYKRRRWNAATKAYVWESSWTVLAEDQVISVSPITEQLDTERLNEFKSSNLTLNLKNDLNAWRQDNPAGIFGPDSASPLYRYSDYWTKFRIRIGVRLQDGTYEYTARFVGLAVEFTGASQDEVQVTVQGLESLLQNANAEHVSTRAVEENVGTGNGVTTAFTTTHPGVGIVEEVSVAGITKVAGTDYSVSNLNSVTLGATITFTAAPASGTIRVTYRYWKQSQKVESLVGDLLTEAGIAGADQLVDPVIFPGGVTQAFNLTTQGDFSAGTLTDMDYTTAPGDLLKDYDASDYEVLEAWPGADRSITNPTPAAVTDGIWTARIDTASSFKPTFNIVSNRLRIRSGSAAPSEGGGTGVMYAPSTRAIGSWSIDVEREANPGTGTAEFGFRFMGQTVATSGTPGTSSYRIYHIDGYEVRWTSSTGNLVLYRTPNSAFTTLGTATVSFTTGAAHTIKVTRTPSGVMKVYVDGTLYITATDTTYNTSNYTGFYVDLSFGASASTIYVDNIKVPTATQTGTFVSATQDALTTPSAWGKLTYDETISGSASSVFSTRSSTDGITFDAWVDIAANGQIQSALKRYLQIRWVPSVDAGSGANNDVLHSISAQYTSSATLLTLANFTGKTVYEELQELGAFANYEWGPTPDEDFFFRAKTVTKTAVATLARETNVSEVNGLVTGQDRVYSEVRATYGAFTSSVKAPGDTEGDVLSKYGSKILEVDGGDVLLAADANVAAGVAAGLAADVRRPRRRLKAVCKLLPYLDLSDVVLVSFNQNQPPRPWFHGDTSVSLGDQTLQHYGPKQQLVSEMYAKVVGARHDPDNFRTELDLQEVL